MSIDNDKIPSNNLCSSDLKSDLRNDQCDDTECNAEYHSYKIGLMGAISIIVGSVIGSGIFATPTIVITMSGSVGMALTIWALCGVTSICMALTFAELGVMIPKTGGEYIYMKEGLGDVIAFVYSVMNCFILQPGYSAISCLVCAEYIIKSIAGHGCSKLVENYAMKLMAAFILGVITLVNMRSTKWTTYVQILTTAAKLLAIAILIITGFYTLSKGMTENFQDSFQGTTSSITSMSYAINGGLWAYGGWNNLNFVTEKIKNPKRNLPLAIILSMVLITICYLLVNIAYISALSFDEIESTNAVAWTLAKKWYGPMSWIVPFFVCCSVIGSLNGGILVKGWLIFATAREKQSFPYMAMIHKQYETPIPALMTALFISWIMLFPEATSFAKLLNYFSFFGFSFAGICCFTLLWLRYKGPNINRGLKVPIIVPIIALCACTFQVIAPFKDNLVESICCLLFMLLGVPLYYVIYTRQLPKFILKANAKFTSLVQLGLNCDFEENFDSR